MDQFQKFLGIWLPILVSGGFVALIKLLWEWCERRQRSRLSEKVNLELPRVPDNLAIFHPSGEQPLYGRSEHIEQLRRAVESHPLLFVWGRSGAGKSTLLKLGLCKELWESRRWLPIYIDIWGADWVNGPWNVLAECVSVAIAEGLSPEERKALPAETVRREDSFALLQILRQVSSRRPLLVFDQLDDYVTQHRNKLLDPQTRCFIPPDELARMNAFWQAIRTLLLEASGDGPPVHAVFCVRTDSRAGMEPFRFCQAATYEVELIHSEDCRTIIDAVVPESAVINPGNGYQQLKERLVKDLTGKEGTFLPIRLRVALAGLKAIRDRLTPAAYRQIGGLAGLEAAYLERQITADPERILSMLLQFVVQDKGVIRTRRDLRREQLPVSDETLEKLQQSRILLRRVVPQEGERWSLYHDYLSFGLVELDRRRRREELDLEEAFSRFETSSGWWQHWLNLLPPRQQLAIWFEWLRGRARFRQRRGFVVASLPRLAVNLPVVALLTAGWYFQAGPIREARELARPFDSNPALAPVELENLWALSTARKSVQDAFWNELVKDLTGIEKLSAHAEPVVMAMAGYSQETRASLAGRLKELVIRTDLDSNIRANLGKALAALSADLKDKAPAQEAVLALAKEIKRASAVGSEQLCRALAALSANLEDTTSALEAARNLAQEIQRQNYGLNGSERLAEVLVTLSANLKDTAPTLEFAHALARNIQVPGLNDSSRMILGRGLIALSANLKDTADTLEFAHALAKGARRPDLKPSARVHLGNALEALSPNLKDTARALEFARTLTKDIQRPNLDPYARVQLGRALAALSANLKDTAHALEFARALAQDLQRPKLDLFARAQLGRALATLSANLMDTAPALEFARALAQEIQRHDPYGELGDALEALSAGLKDTASVLEFARALVKDIQGPDLDRSARERFANALAALSPNLKDTAHVLEFARALAQEVQRPDLAPNARGELSRALAVLSANLKDSAPTLEFARALAQEIQRPFLGAFAHKKFCSALLAALSPNLKGTAPALEFARALEQDIQRRDLNRSDRADLGSALAALSAGIANPGDRKVMLATALTLGRADLFQCWDLAGASRRDDVSVVAEILQWPQCVSQTESILQRAEKLVFSGPERKERKFRNLAAFLSWVRVENAAGRNVADLDQRPPNPFASGFTGWLGRLTARLGT